MKIVLFGGFDCGFSIGIDDRPFENPRKPRDDGLIEATQDDPEERFGIVPSFGAGICFSALDWKPVQDWLADARSVAASADFHSFMGVNLTNAALLSETLKRYPATDCWVELYSCGIALLVLVTDGIPDDCDADVLTRMAQAYEYAAYGKFSPTDSIQRALRETFSGILKDSATDPEIKKVTEPSYFSPNSVMAPANSIALDIFPGFNILFFSSTLESVEKLKRFRETRHDSFAELYLEEFRLYVTWYVSIVRTNPAGGPRRWRRVLRAFLLYELSLRACESFQTLLKSQVAKFVSNSTSPSTIDVIKLRARTLTYLMATDYITVTQHMEMIALFRELDKVGSLPQRRDSLRDGAEILHVVQRDTEQDTRERRERGINLVLRIIAFLGVISVVADLLNIYSSSSLHFRVLVYIGVLLLFIAIIVQLHCWRRTKTRTGLPKSRAHPD